MQRLQSANIFGCDVNMYANVTVRLIDLAFVRNSNNYDKWQQWPKTQGTQKSICQNMVECLFLKLLVTFYLWIQFEMKLKALFSLSSTCSFDIFSWMGIKLLLVDRCDRSSRNRSVFHLSGSFLSLGLYQFQFHFSLTSNRASSLFPLFLSIIVIISGEGKATTTKINPSLQVKSRFSRLHSSFYSQLFK